MTLSPHAAAVKAVLEAKPGAVAAPLASAAGVVLYKVMGKMFAILEDSRVQVLILKCDPQLVEVLCEQYEGVGHRGHLDRRFWISVALGADVPPQEIERLCGHSYDLVRAKLTRKQRAELETLSA